MFNLHMLCFYVSLIHDMGVWQEYTLDSYSDIKYQDNSSFNDICNTALMSDLLFSAL